MRKAVERMLQELIEAAIDINVHIIAESVVRSLRITMRVSSGRGTSAFFHRLLQRNSRRQPVEKQAGA